jgi:hypothetical protein
MEGYIVSERMDKAEPTLQELRETLEREKVKLSIDLATAASQFVDMDHIFNNMLLKAFNLVIEAIEKNPDIVVDSNRTDLDAAIAQLEKQPEQCTEPGIEGGDIVGGAADWIEDLERIVKALTGVVQDEKDFFLQIIKLIFCGCSK